MYSAYSLRLVSSLPIVHCIQCIPPTEIMEYVYPVPTVHMRSEHNSYCDHILFTSPVVNIESAYITCCESVLYVHRLLFTTTLHPSPTMTIYTYHPLYTVSIINATLYVHQVYTHTLYTPHTYILYAHYLTYIHTP